MSNEVEDSNHSSRLMFGQTKVNQNYKIKKLNMGLCLFHRKSRLNCCKIWCAESDTLSWKRHKPWSSSTKKSKSRRDGKWLDTF